MYTRTTTVVNKTGLHARPASDFVKAAKEFDSKITIKNVTTGAGPVSAKSIVMLLTLALSQGNRIEISADGACEEDAVDALIALVDGGFGEL